MYWLRYSILGPKSSLAVEAGPRRPQNPSLITRSGMPTDRGLTIRRSEALANVYDAWNKCFTTPRGPRATSCGVWTVGREETMGCRLPGRANLEAPMPPILWLHANFAQEYLYGCV